MLAGGTLAVLVGAVLVAWTTPMRELYSDTRIANTELAAAQANERAAAATKEAAGANERSAVLESKVAESNERAARLENEAAQARERAAHLATSVAAADARAAEAQLALERFKAPRGISNPDKIKMAANLSAFALQGAAIFAIGDTIETSALGQSIQAVLSSANWNVNFWQWSGVGGITGVVVFSKLREAGAQAAAEALVTELRAAGIASVIEQWPAAWEQVGGMLNGPNPPAPANAVLRVVVGAKPQ
jgi:hypothetical protein